jgi:hypothetical protein
LSGLTWGAQQWDPRQSGFSSVCGSRNSENVKIYFEGQFTVEISVLLHRTRMFAQILVTFWFLCDLNQTLIRAPDNGKVGQMPVGLMEEATYCPCFKRQFMELTICRTLKCRTVVLTNLCNLTQPNYVAFGLRAVGRGQYYIRRGNHPDCSFWY